jgi:polyisoprenoid-binding protein YceI
MKTKIIFALTFLIAIITTAQEKVSTKSGLVKFEASTENFEPVTATNKTTSAILKDDGTFAALTLIKGFQFKKALMQEHFNQEKFMHSEKFPKAKFAGKIADFNSEKLSEKVSEFKVLGKLTIHGETKDVTTVANIKKVDGVVYVDTKFSIQVADYGIIIKSKLAKKVAETVNISMALELK